LVIRFVLNQTKHTEALGGGGTAIAAGNRQATTASAHPHLFLELLLQPLDGVGLGGSVDGGGSVLLPLGRLTPRRLAVLHLLQGGGAGRQRRKFTAVISVAAARVSAEHFWQPCSPAVIEVSTRQTDAQKVGHRYVHYKEMCVENPFFC